jgi:adenylate cyclase
VRLRLEPMRVGVQVKLSLAIAAALVGVVGLSTWLLYTIAVRELAHEFGNKLMAMAASGTLGIDGDAFARLSDPKQMASDDWRRIHAYLVRLREVNADVHPRFVYTMAPTDKPGIWRYVVDSADPASDDFSKLGDTADFTYRPEWMHPLTRPLAEWEIQEYQGWGQLASASAPIFDSRGHPVGIVGVDAAVDTVVAARTALRRRAALFAALGILVSIAVSMPLAWMVTRPVRALIGATARVAQGDFTHQVPVRSRDELGELAQAFNRMTRGLHERELYKRQFERYVSRQVADKILANPEKAFWDGERRTATVLFSDIRGFTAMAERIPPEEVVRRLNEYLALMIDIVFQHEGTLDKFIGDAVMAVFGAPMSFGDDEARAVRTAVAMQETAAELGLRWQKAGLPAFKIGVGIHTGEVVVGTIGSERRMEYSAIGDTVNVASRMESLNKEHGTTILISGATHAKVASLVRSRFVDRVAVRGREQTIEIYEVLGLVEPT